MALGFWAQHARPADNVAMTRLSMFSRSSLSFKRWRMGNYDLILICIVQRVK